MYPIFSKFPFFYAKHKDEEIKASLEDICPRTEAIDLHHLFDLDLLDTTRQPREPREDRNKDMYEPMPMQDVHTEEQQTKPSTSSVFSKVWAQKYRRQEQEQQHNQTAAPPIPPRTASQQPQMQQPVVTIKTAIDYINRITGNQFSDELTDRNYDDCMKLIQRAKLNHSDPLPQEYADELVRYISRFK